MVHVDQKVARECYVESLRVEPTRQDNYGNRSLDNYGNRSLNANPLKDEGPLAEKPIRRADNTRSPWLTWAKARG